MLTKMNILVMELNLTDMGVVNEIIFGVDMSSSTKIHNRKKDILILGKGPTQGLEHTVTAEKMFSINFTKKKPQKFV